MPKIILLAPIAGLLLCMVTAAAMCDPADDWARAFMAKTQAPGVALAVIRDGKVVKAATYGYANLEWRQPVTRDTLFWQDSVTKLFTAVGILQLADTGKLALDEAIAKYLTDAPAAWRGVTIRQLLAHTSGIKDDYWQTYRGSMLVDYDEKDIHAYAFSQPMISKPGEKYAYSSEGYYLLGVIIAKATGEPYTKWMTEHVLRPAGMKTARMFNAWEVVPHMVSSYALKDGHVVHNRDDIMSDRGEAIASWGLYASLDDMIAFDAALKGGRLISPKSLDTLWSNAKLNSGYPSPGSLGFTDVTYPLGHREAYKDGQAGVVYDVFPDDGVSVILLTNLKNAQWHPVYSATNVATLFDPAIRPLSSLTPHPDPNPARTARLRHSMMDVANGVSLSPLLTAGMSGAMTPQIRANIKRLLGSMSGFQFLACENASPSDPYGAVQYCYYRTRIPSGPLDLGFGLAPDGKLAAGSGQPE